MENPRPILLVEDSPDDVFFLRRALKAKNFDMPLEVATDGRAAIEHLRAAASANREERRLPGLVLLDLQMPYFTGLQVLEWIRQQPSLRRIPVVIFSSSSQARDIDQAYDLGANSYLVKPADAAELRRLVESLCSYWLNTNHGPGL